MRDPHDIIIRPIVTENSMDLMADKKYTFVVDKRSNKTEIKNAVEQVFGVKVEKVNTMNMLGKKKRMGVHIGKKADWKKAIITLKEDSKTIEFFDGIARCPNPIYSTVGRKKLMVGHSQRIPKIYDQRE